jgi:PAS domain S-box-containing protein
MAGWSVQIAVMTWPTQLLPVHLSTLIRYLFQLLVVFGWPLLVWEYSNRKRLSLRPWQIAALLVVPVLTIGLTATNPWHYLVLTAETPSNPAGIRELGLGPWYLVYMGFAVTMVMLPIGTLFSDLREAHGTHRKQILLLLAGWFLGFPGALFSLLFRDLPTVPPYVDLTPLTFILAAGLWGTALFRYNLFSMLPVSRRIAVETMPDPVVSVDSDGAVVDANPAAQQLFGTTATTGTVAGTPLTEFCAAYPAVPSLYQSGEEQTAELSLDTDAGTRHFSVYVEPIRQGGSTTGSLLVLREVTTLREREQELDLLKQVLSRVFRHNIRNRLNVIEGHTRALASATDDEREAHIETILGTVDQLLGHSDKAVAMRKAIDTEPSETPLSISTVVRQQTAALRKTHPEITVTVDCPDEITAPCHPDIDKAVAELLENAVKHSEGPPNEFHVRIAVTRRDGMVVVGIEDNGPSIAAHEIEALNAGQETDLTHGSGVGLWLVRLLADKSGGDLSIDDGTDLGGTRVELTLPAPVPTDSHPSE